MGAQYSCPCVSGRTPQKRSTRVKANKNFSEDSDNELYMHTASNSYYHQNESPDNSTKKPLNYLEVTPGSHSDRRKRPYESIYSCDTVLCEEVDDFPSLIQNQLENWRYSMEPSVIAPHPFQKKALIVLKPSSYPGQSQKYEFYDFEEDFQGISFKVIYQKITSLFRAWLMKGLDYIGYFVDRESKYHFIWVDKREHSEEHKTSYLHFQVLEDLDPEEIDKTLTEVSQKKFKIKGVISIRDSIDHKKILSFVVFEKEPAEKGNYVIVDLIPKILLGKRTIVDFCSGIKLSLEDNVIFLFYERLISLGDGIEGYSNITYGKRNLLNHGLNIGLYSSKNQKIIINISGGS